MSLLLITPDAEAIVGPWRAEHDWTAAYGVPAHVTVRTPFLPPPQWDVPALARTLAGTLPLELTLARLEDRPGALVVLVEPDEELWELTHAVSARWPSLGPHKGGRPDAAFHVTVVRTADPAVRAAARARIETQLPRRVTGTELWCAEGSPETGVTTAVVARA